jgi:hypothetical protein
MFAKTTYYRLKIISIQVKVSHLNSLINKLGQAKTFLNIARAQCISGNWSCWVYHERCAEFKR